jgi:hypothetical protein
MTWRNGFIPESELIIFHRGWNATDGDWFHGFTPGTYARHLALVARAKARTGRDLYLSSGWSSYRPMHAQEIARRIWGNGAAWPGTSSHGGFWEGRETLAGDYGNWAWVYENHGGRAAFYEDCRAVGLTPGMIEPSRGYPDEPWHVIDLNPRNAPAPAGDSATPFPQEDPMPTLREIYEAVWHGFTFKSGRTPGQELVQQGTRLARLELQLADLRAQGTGRFFKHGNRAVTLWVFVHESGDFVRIRDENTAKLYRALNGGKLSTTVTGEALRQMIADLSAAGGRDLAAVPDSEDTTVTSAEQIAADDETFTDPLATL